MTTQNAVEPKESREKREKETAENKKVGEFLNKFAALSAEYGYDISAKLNFTENGIFPQPIVTKKKQDEKK